MTIRTLRMAGGRDVTNLARCPQVTGRTDSMAGCTTGCARVIHGRRSPRRTDGMTAAAGIGGHRCRFMRLGTCRRPTSGTDTIMASSTIAAGRNTTVSKRSRLPGCSVVAAVALRVTGSRDMRRLLAGRAHAIVAVGTTARRRDLAVIERGWHPPGGRMTNAALLPSGRDMSGLQPGGTRTVMAVVTTPSSDLLDCMCK